VHLWGGVNAEFEKRKWGQANGYASTGSVIAGNRFLGDDLAFQFRGPGEVTLGSNQFVGVAKEIMGEPAYEVKPNSKLATTLVQPARFEVLGKTHPVGARPELRGRQNIVMTEWGPWNHVTPIARFIKSSGTAAVYEVLKVPVADLKTEIIGEHVKCAIEPIAGRTSDSRVTVLSTESGLCSYTLKIKAADRQLDSFTGTLISAKWQATFFKWANDADPRTNSAAYSKLAQGPTAVSDQLDELSFHYGMRGPSDLGISKKITDARLGQHHFGMIARTRLPLTKGNWQFGTLSDDGVRVSVDGKPVIDNWTWHGPTRDTGQLKLESDKTVELTVEHFQIDGYAVLEFSITRAQ
jgi:hypothetical protein